MHWEFNESKYSFGLQEMVNENEGVIRMTPSNISRVICRREPPFMSGFWQVRVFETVL